MLINKTYERTLLFCRNSLDIVTKKHAPAPNPEFFGVLLMLCFLIKRKQNVAFNEILRLKKLHKTQIKYFQEKHNFLRSVFSPS